MKRAIHWYKASQQQKNGERENGTEKCSQTVSIYLVNFHFEFVDENK